MHGDWILLRIKNLRQLGIAVIKVPVSFLQFYRPLAVLYGFSMGKQLRYMILISKTVAIEQCIFYNKTVPLPI